MQAFPRVTIQCNALITEDIVDEPVHGGFLEGARPATVTLERSRSLDLL